MFDGAALTENKEEEEGEHKFLINIQHASKKNKFLFYSNSSLK